jgi:ATP-binding cassette subfamily C (CFTR/MRP) protein 1
VLKGVSFAVNAREKVGIVGRTGAGKSSLIMALFRINGLSGGRILLDGVDIATVPLHTLRSRLAIIPQSPVLFKGELREYMDPFGDFSDAQIWLALDKVGMAARLQALVVTAAAAAAAAATAATTTATATATTMEPTTTTATIDAGACLQIEVSENGDNFSVGERQLLCMARALLAKSRIVVLDEATASVDRATEEQVQAMLARDFRDATVLTIAHRLATVVSSDRIVVMRGGQVAEMGPPRELAADRTGEFHRLAKEAGCLDDLLA